MILKVLEYERIKVGQVVVDPQMHKRNIITNGARQPLQRVHMTYDARDGCRGTARGRPSICTSVTVIGLNLAAPN
eukprot:scaffold11739_cov129-Isochrysis_galbana.AAC.10